LTTTVFVIHGIGNRDPAGFNRDVATLAKKIGITAHPVYWGNLGASYEWIARTVPGAPDTLDPSAGPAPEVDALAHFLATSKPPSAGVSGDSQIPEPVVAAGTETVVGMVGGRGIHAEVLADSEAELHWLPLIDDAELKQAVVDALTAPIGDVATDTFDGGGFPQLSLRGPDARRLWEESVKQMDHVVGAAFNAAAGKLNSHLRARVLPALARAVGDILVYQRHRAEICDLVRAEIRAVDSRLGRTAEHPVDILAHSLGGVIAFDLATSDDPIWVRTLVTFGSQPSFFHVCDPRGGKILRYNGSAVTLPKSIDAWTNLWEPLDLLAFVAEPIFKLHDGSPPKDAEVEHLASSGLWTHSAYWHLDEVVRRIQEALGVQSPRT
jgi:hypothetical protein